jgi:hypothetical protein
MPEHRFRLSRLRTATMCLTGVETAINGLGVYGHILSSGSFAEIRTTANGATVVNGANYIVSGFYEVGK